ncbi:MAG: MarR family transcriptional regulator [Ignavibacteriae bacterium HGW-Ignavibacteriae-2]|jgi:MarR family 2-MHQ and catechol resistance regulon transcriptional repressor|nr:MarR family transcriptional regulator [Bacteroidota bacterium]PKL90153.1 MAG: MarR family transcriptional regulator [Ignavibacteriae bacterium HGW-Ignavibacteriae-2]
MENQKDNIVLDVWDKLNHAYDSVKKAHSRQMYAHNLTAPQFHVLEVLMKTGPIPLKKISEELLVTGANITCVVDNLEKEDLVKRVPSKKDRRIINAELTDKGREKIDNLFPEYSNGLSESMKELTENEKKELIRLLEKVSG